VAIRHRSRVDAPLPEKELSRTPLRWRRTVMTDVQDIGEQPVGRVC